MMLKFNTTRTLALLLLLCASAIPAVAVHASGQRRQKPVAKTPVRKRQAATTVTSKTIIADKLPSAVNGMPIVPPVVKELDAAGLLKVVPAIGAGRTPEGRPLLVNFWATWCEPCRDEFPDLVKIDADYKGRGLDFVVVSADEIDELTTGVPKFLSQMRATMPAYLLRTPDTAAAIAAVDPAWGGELPATFLFDRDGKIVYRHTGRVNPDELRAAIEKTMNDERGTMK